MIPTDLPNIANIVNFSFGNFTPILMQLSFFSILLFSSLSLLVSFLHLVWYGTSTTKGYISIIIYLVVSVPLFLYAFSLMPKITSVSLNIL